MAASGMGSQKLKSRYPRIGIAASEPTPSRARVASMVASNTHMPPGLSGIAARAVATP